MTWQRVVGRNGLRDGDYDKAPLGWRVMCNTNPSDDAHPSIGEVRRQWLVRQEDASKRLAGDIRRLEQDARDERSISGQITNRTGISSDVVAAVLKEFFDL